MAHTHPMGRYLLKRALLLISILCSVVLITFILMEYSPIDAVQSYIRRQNVVISQDQVEAFTRYWKLDQSPFARFIMWIEGVLKGDFGESMLYRRPVLEVIKEHFMVSFLLLLASWILTGVFGYILGILCGVYEGSWLDKIIRSLAMAIESMPVFWLGMCALFIFSVQLQWLPFGLSAPIGVTQTEVTIAEHIRHAILPLLTLTVANSAHLILYMRDRALEIMVSPYVLFARTQGESTFQIIHRHVLKNSLSRFITLHLMSFSQIFSGALIVESVFSYPGLGQVSVQAGLNNDIYLLLAIVIFSTIIVFSANTVADILNNYLAHQRSGGHHEIN